MATQVLDTVNFPNGLGGDQLVNASTIRLRAGVVLTTVRSGNRYGGSVGTVGPGGYVLVTAAEYAIQSRAIDGCLDSAPADQSAALAAIQ